MSTPEIIKILFLAAIPQDTTHLQIDDEMRAIDQALRMSEYQEQFDLRSHWAVRYSDLQELLLRHQPHIVHFSGHGSPASEIILEGEDGIHPVSPAALSTLFAILKDKLRCVVLNACYSEVQARAIAQHIDCVIGMADIISDTASINFASAFYRALGYGRSIQEAFALGCNAINLAKLTDKDVPHLLALHTDPAEVVLIIPESSGQSSIVRTGLEPAVPTQPLRHGFHNLPLPRDTLIGREMEVARVQTLLLRLSVGLVTLTGPGGVGKTRLALQVAATMPDHFVDGVYFVSLAPISDPDLVVPTIAQALSVREAGEQPLQESLQAYLRDKQLLLVLDNFEQVVAAAPLVAELLANCRRLKILVTSRTTLHLYGEHEFPVPPLALPDFKRFAPGEADLATNLAQVAAVALFAQRAQAARPDFTLTTANAPVIAEICIRLDGLPLTIELAAAKLKLFSPSALLARLNERLTLLTGGPHDQPERQRTLRNAIAWSYDLLTAEEQMLFRRLAVFIDGFTLEAAQAIGNADGDLAFDVMAGVATLVDQNLLKRFEQSDGEPRFGMLETIREYGSEQLAACGEAEVIHRQYARFFLALAEATGLGFVPDEQGVGLAQLVVEHANLRAALAWNQRDEETEIALRLANALAEFWSITGRWSEGRRWLEVALARTTAAEHTVTRALALVHAGDLAVMQGDYSTAHRWLEEGMAIAKEQGAQLTIAFALTALGWIAQTQQDYDLAITRHRESLAIRREIGSKLHIASAIANLGGVLYGQHDYVGAQSLYEESLALFQELGAEWDIADVLHSLGQVKQCQRDYTRAWALFRESLMRWRTLGTLQWKGVADCLEGLANICATQRQFFVHVLTELGHMLGDLDFEIYLREQAAANHGVPC